jgi:hypothetical protein
LILRETNLRDQGVEVQILSPRPKIPNKYAARSDISLRAIFAKSCGEFRSAESGSRAEQSASQFRLKRLALE